MSYRYKDENNIFNLLFYKTLHSHCVVPENTHTSPTGGIFKTPPAPSGNSTQPSYISFIFCVLQNSTTPRNFNSFSGMGSMDIFRNCTLYYL